MSPGIPPGQPPEAGETRKGSFLSPGRSAALLDSRLVVCRTVRKFVSVVLSLPVVVICHNSPRNLTHLCPCSGCGPWGSWGQQGPGVNRRPTRTGHHCPLVAPAGGSWPGDPSSQAQAQAPLKALSVPHMPGWPESDTTLAALENQVYFSIFCQNIKKRKTRKMRQEHSRAEGPRQGGKRGERQEGLPGKGHVVMA